MACRVGPWLRASIPTPHAREQTPLRGSFASKLAPTPPHPRHSPVGARPARESRAGPATVPGSTAFRRMALSAAIPISATAWVSQAQPILRKAPRRKTVTPTVPGSTAFRRMALSEAIPISATAWVSHAQPILRRAPRRKTVTPTVPGNTAFRRMALSAAIPISATTWVSQAQPILRKTPRRRQLLLRLQEARAERTLSAIGFTGHAGRPGGANGPLR